MYTVDQYRIFCCIIFSLNNFMRPGRRNKAQGQRMQQLRSNLSPAGHDGLPSLRSFTIKSALMMEKILLFTNHPFQPEESGGGGGSLVTRAAGGWAWRLNCWPRCPGGWSPATGSPWVWPGRSPPPPPGSRASSDPRRTHRAQPGGPGRGSSGPGGGPSGRLDIRPAPRYDPPPGRK